MNILVVGTYVNYQECVSKFGDAHDCRWQEDVTDDILTETTDVVFDFTFKDDKARLKHYAKNNALAVFIETTVTKLTNLIDAKGNINCALFGFCGLPTFFTSSVLELSLWNNKHDEKLREVCSRLQTEYLIVADAPGFVTPRTICMIINEAYFAAEEGVASRVDIDNAMKLGTNYPYGPFEWCERIGVKNVFDVLNAIYTSTQDDRYKVCGLLRTESMK